MRRDWNILRRDRSVGSRYAVEVRNKYEALEEVAEDEGVNRDWRILQDSLEDSAEKLNTKGEEKRKTIVDDRGDLGFYGTTSENEEPINRQI